MTIEELLELAQAHVSYAHDFVERNSVDFARANAAIAQAAAQTAQAMTLRQMCTSGTDYNGNDMLVLMTSALK